MKVNFKKDKYKRDKYELLGINKKLDDTWLKKRMKQGMIILRDNITQYSLTLLTRYLSKSWYILMLSKVQGIDFIASIKSL